MCTISLRASVVVVVVDVDRYFVNDTKIARHLVRDR